MFCGKSGSLWSAFKDREGNLWIGTFGAGLAKLNQEKFITLDKEYGLVNNAVNDIYQDSKNNVWFATESGISMLDSNLALSSFQELDGFKLEKITQFAEDNRGNIHFSNYLGIPQGVSFIFNNGSCRPLYLTLHQILPPVSGVIWVIGVRL